MVLRIKGVYMSCPYCGGNQVISHEPFSLEGDCAKTLVDVEHMRCTSCDGVELTLEQMDKVAHSAAV